MEMILVRCTHNGDKAWKWEAPTGKKFYFYQSRNDRKWRYMREDWSSSGLGFDTLAAARMDLERFFEES